MKHFFDIKNSIILIYLICTSLSLMTSTESSHASEPVLSRTMKYEKFNPPKPQLLSQINRNQVSDVEEDEFASKEQTKKELIEIIYKYCRSSNQSEGLKDLNDFQCSCTADKMKKHMRLNMVKSLFANDEGGDYAYAEMMLYAYIPCLSLTLKDLVIDECLKGPSSFTKKRDIIDHCECTGERIEDNVFMGGESLMAGYRGFKFEKANASADQLSYAIQTRDFNQRIKAYSRRCKTYVEQTID